MSDTKFVYVVWFQTDLRHEKRVIDLVTDDKDVAFNRGSELIGREFKYVAGPLKGSTEKIIVVDVEVTHMGVPDRLWPLRHLWTEDAPKRRETIEQLRKMRESVVIHHPNIGTNGIDTLLERLTVPGVATLDVCFEQLVRRGPYSHVWEYEYLTKFHVTTQRERR